MVSGKPSGGMAELEHPSVLIADDDIPHRQAVREALERHGFVVVGEASDAAAAIGAATRLQPDICLIEIKLPVEGLNAIGRIAKASSETMIVVLSSSDHPEDVVTAFTRGASGYLLKGINGERLASTLRGAYHGEPPLSRSLVPYLVDEIRRGSIRRLTALQLNATGMNAASAPTYAIRLFSRRMSCTAPIPAHNPQQIQASAKK